MLRNQDVLAGALFFLIGVGAVAFARDYEMGTAMRMGPAYFPTVLGRILYVFGAFLLLRGIARGGAVAAAWGWKPLAFVPLSMLAFGFVVTRLGLLPALAAMVFLAASGGREFRFREVLALTAVLAAFAVGVFIHVLKLPFQLIAGF